MTTRYERHTGKMIGPKWNEDPNAYRRPGRATDFNAPSPNELAAKREEQLRKLEEMQRNRPRKPPGVKR